MDVVIAALLILFNRADHLANETDKQFWEERHKIVFLIGIWLFSGIFCYEIIKECSFQTLVEIGQVIDNGKTVQLEPLLWIGKEFPLTNYIIPSRKDMKGIDSVLLYRPGCPVCEEIITLLNKDQILHKRNLIMLEIRGVRNIFDWKKSDDSAQYDNIHLTTEVNWFLESPILLKLHNNIVTQVITREELHLLSQKETSKWKNKL
ncbi:MAG: hypothetical protein Q4F84_05670 [Fibrobacter sp.]|nr:hypothetical protein [Fibrobacter sp.]